jgi:hypothetical protein
VVQVAAEFSFISTKYPRMLEPPSSWGGTQLISMKGARLYVVSPPDLETKTGAASYCFGSTAKRTSNEVE